MNCLLVSSATTSAPSATSRRVLWPSPQPRSRPKSPSMPRGKRGKSAGRIVEIAVGVVARSGELDPGRHIGLPDPAGVRPIHPAMLACRLGTQGIGRRRDSVSRWTTTGSRTGTGSNTGTCSRRCSSCSGTRAATGEAVDEAFARALERWPRVRTMDSPMGWTFTVARNRLRRGASSRREIVRSRTP